MKLIKYFIASGFEKHDTIASWIYLEMYKQILPSQSLFENNLEEYFCSPTVYFIEILLCMCSDF